MMNPLLIVDNAEMARRLPVMNTRQRRVVRRFSASGPAVLGLCPGSSWPLVPAVESTQANRQRIARPCPESRILSPALRAATSANGRHCIDTPVSMFKAGRVPKQASDYI